MVVMILEKVPAGLRGELTRWMIEPKTGVFVGSLSGMVRDKMWERVCAKSKDGGCIMLHSFNNEQRFCVRVWGNTARKPMDYEGLVLMCVPR